MATVWDQAQRRANENFDRLDGRPYTSEALHVLLREVLADFPGMDLKKWLFIYSPGSLSPFFEVGLELPRMMIGLAKLHRVASEGGMLLGADFSENWGTPQSVGRFIPLAVCKPTDPGGSNVRRVAPAGQEGRRVRRKKQKRSHR